MTIEQLKKITGITDAVKLASLLEGITETFIKYSINTVQRQRHFIAQIQHESINFSAVIENLNYSAAALLATFPKHFTAAEANEYARKPEKIGNRAYANRLGNGDEASGEGFKFRGRGFLQITGKSNYVDIGKSLGLDLITHPELLEQPKYAMLSAGWFWNSRNLNTVADISKDDVTKVTKIINGGVIGLKDRQDKYNILKTILI
jgi:putative chitinase